MTAFGWVQSISVNGTELSDPRFNIETVSAGTPTRRGSNLIPAMGHGGSWRRKRLGVSNERWTMWVCDAKADGTVYPPTWSGTGTPTTTGQKQQLAQLNANLDEIKGLLYTSHKASGYDAPLMVVKKLQSNAASPADSYRVNYGEVVSPIKIAESDHNYVRFTASVDYLDPRWYECNSAGAKTASTMQSGGGSEANADPGGTAVTTRMTIKLTAVGASVADPWVQNVTTGSKLTWNGTLDDGDHITFDTEAYTATLVDVSDGNATTYPTGNVDRTGSTTLDWFELRPGIVNDINKKTNANVVITYSKAYI